MSGQLTAVVAGFPQMAEALSRSGRFAQVIPAASTSQLREQIMTRLSHATPAEVVFCFADTLTVDTQENLPYLVQYLTANGWRVLIFELGPNAADLVTQHQDAGLVRDPFTVNGVLAAVSNIMGLSGPTLLAPTPDGNVTISALASSEHRAAPIADPFGSQAPLQAPSPMTQPGMVDTHHPVEHPAAVPHGAAPHEGPDGGPHGGLQGNGPTAADPFADPFAPAAAPSPAAPSPAAPAAASPSQSDPFGRPAPAGSGQDPFAQEASAAAPAPAGGFTAPAATGGWQGAPEPSTPAAAPTTQDPFAQTAPQAPADPFATQPTAPAHTDLFTQSAPTGPTQDPFAQTAPQAPADPFATQPTAPAGGAATTTTWETPQTASDPFEGGMAPRQDLQGPSGFQEPAAPVDPFGASAPPSGADPFAPPAQVQAVEGLAARDGAAVHIPQARQRGMMIAVTAPKGGTGKSTFTLNAASYLGLRLQGAGKSVCVLDANIQQADAGKYLGFYDPTVIDVVKSMSDGPLTPQSLSKFIRHKPELGISVLLGPATPLEANPNYINGRLYTQIIGVLRQMFDYIVVDTPVAEVYHNLFQDFVLPEADFLCVVATQNIPTLLDIDMYLRTITSPSAAGGSDFDSSAIGYLINQYQDGVGLDEDVVRNELPSWRYLGLIPETVQWRKACNEYRIVATANYHELNEAFARILYAATGEPILAGEGSSLRPTRSMGLLEKIKRTFKG